MLMGIKLLHTLIWTLLASSILALPVAGVIRQFRGAAILTGLVVLECLRLGVGRLRAKRGREELATRFGEHGTQTEEQDTGQWLLKLKAQSGLTQSTSKTLSALYLA